MENTWRRSANFIQGKGYITKKEKDAKKAAKAQTALDTIYANAEMPDDEVIQRNERRKAARRRGSRVNTILTDDEKETMG